MAGMRTSAGWMLTAVLLGGLPVPAGAAAAAAPSAGQRIYDSECASCHGAKGKGDGEESTYLTPQPQDFTTGIIQKRDDAFLTSVVSKGGASKGLSPSMPAFPKLSKTDVQNVVAYVRELAKGTPAKK